MMNKSRLGAARRGRLPEGAPDRVGRHPPAEGAPDDLSREEVLEGVHFF